MLYSITSWPTYTTSLTLVIRQTEVSRSVFLLTDYSKLSYLFNYSPPRLWLADSLSLTHLDAGRLRRGGGAILV